MSWDEAETADGGGIGPSDTSESGSVLMLMPAAVLILLVLGAIAVDSAIVFMAQRELQSATAAAANDAAVAALEEHSLYECGDLRIAQGRARDVAHAAFAARSADAVETDELPEVTVAGGTASEPVEVTVAARGHVGLIFAPAVSEWSEQEVTASSTSSPVHTPGAMLPSVGDC